MSVQILTSLRSELNEGPLWHADQQVVYFVDIESGTLYKFDPSTAQTEKVLTGPKIGGFTIQQDGSLLLFRENGEVVSWNGEALRVIIAEIPDEVGTRFNDVNADPVGRVFCGMMPNGSRPGRLYRLDRDGSIRVVLEGIGCSNGMDFSLDHKTMYYTDSSKRCIYTFDYDESTGEISNQKTLIELPAEYGAPDGMTLDAQGDLWVAVWGGDCILHFNSKGDQIKRHSLPANKVTCPTFGGPQLSHLYVTTAGGQHKEDGEGAGELLRLNVGVSGKPGFRSRVMM